MNEPGSMLVLTATGSRLFDFQTRMRAVWRHYVFMTRVIRQKNGIDTLYTLRTTYIQAEAQATQH